MHSLRRAYEWLLFGQTRWGLSLLAILGALPLALSPFDHTFFDIAIANKNHAPTSCEMPPGGLVFHGLQSSHNWWIFILFLPLSLHFLRQSIRRYVGHSSDRQLPLSLLVDETARAAVSTRLRVAILSLWTPAVVASIILIVAFFDLGNVVPAYAHNACQDEKDWTTFFLLPDHVTSRTANAVHVMLAYAVQYATGFLGLLSFGLSLVYNVLYLRLIYQRRRTTDPSPFIALQIDDPECCFGQDALRPAFRIQVLYVVIAGVAVSFSRYHNVATTTTHAIWLAITKAIREGKGLGCFMDVWKVFTNIAPSQLFPDSGQWSLGIIFTIVFFVAGLPSLIKFLPFGRPGMLTTGDMAQYLAEFIPPGKGPEPETMKREALHKLAGDFALNSFWPASDEVARRLFAFAFAVLIFIFLPVPLSPPSLIVVYSVLVIAFSVTLTAATFLVYEYILAYIGKPLVTPRKD